MAGSTALVATLMENPTLEALKEIPRQVSMLEVRGDSASLLPADLLRQYFPGELIYSTWRGIIDGSPSFPAARHCALKQAARDYDLVQLHADHDLTPEMLAAVPAQQRLICWKGTAQSLAQLRASFKRISAVPARFYLLVTQSDRIDAGAIPLLLLKELGRRDVIAYCEGKAGFWSRILSVHFGAPLIFGTAEDAPLGSGEPTVQQLIQDFGLPSLHPVRELYGIVGTRVFHSPSPRVHNAGYRALAHPALFLPFYAGSFEEFWREMIEDGSLDAVGLSLQGLTIISPYKETAFALAGWRSPMAQRAGACNLFLRRNDFWEAHTTDTDSIAGMAPASLRKAAVIGCGGAGRAIAAALQQSGANVTLVNRGKQRGEFARDLLGLSFVPLPEFQARGFTLVVNATPVGRDDECLPFDIGVLDGGATVIDLVLRTAPTPLVSSVAARGGLIVDGYEVLLHQVRKQFYMMTGREMPREIGRETAYGCPSEKIFCLPELHVARTLFAEIDG